MGGLQIPIWLDLYYCSRPDWRKGQFMSPLTTRCKGTTTTKKGERRCPEEVTFVPRIIDAFVEDDADYDVYLTCDKFRHTCKYWVTSHGRDLR